MMYMACIDGWATVQAFSEDKEKAKRLAVKRKKEVDGEETYPLEKRYTWKNCEEYYGAWVVEIKEGLVLSENSEER